MFRTEDCPAKVASQPQRHSYPKQSSGKPRGPDLPPGFEGNHYAVKPNVSNIPRIKWKRPPKVKIKYNPELGNPLKLLYLILCVLDLKQFAVNDAWLVGGGGESSERRTENLRISKVLQAIYPHRSAIPSRYLPSFLAFETS